ncbi:GatB/YqeY domain-containing protein, partial [Klebsiella pneumoniae]|nr:GatB/YqeY domain-containing protein [Klebsiella pneumoniae]
EVDDRVELDDAMVVSIVDKLIKQRKDAAQQYEAAARADLADKEKAEITVLEAYLPQRLTADEIHAAVKAIVVEMGAAGPGDMG